MDVKVTAVRANAESSFGTSFTATTRGSQSGGGGALGYVFVLALALLRALHRRNGPCGLVRGMRAQKLVELLRELAN
jgi:hypothetical protein